MSQSGPDNSSLDALLIALLDDTIDSDGMDHLERILIEDPAARQKYLKLSSLHAALQWLYGGHRNSANSAEDAAFDSIDLLSIIEEHAQYLRERDVAVISHLSEPIWSEQFRHGRRYRRGDDKPIARLIFIPWTVVCVAAAACVILAAVLWSQIKGIETTPEQASQLPFTEQNRQDATPSVAVVRSSIDARWVGLNPWQSRIAENQWLSLEAGFAELELNDGARVIVQAPATFGLTGKNAMRLEVGRLVAYVPAQANGFTIDTPGGQILDLGTEFGVHTKPGGGVDVHVFEGEIVVSPGENASGQEQISLVAGQAIQIDMQGVVSEASADEEAFVRPIVYSAMRDADALAAARWVNYTDKLRRDPSLLAFYTFDDNTLVNRRYLNTASATKGRLNAEIGDGREMSAPVPATDRFGQAEQAVSFSRRNQQALFVHDWPEVGQLDALTISCWFRMAEDYNPEFALLVTNWNDYGRPEDGRFSFHLGLRSGQLNSGGPVSNSFGLQSHLSLDGIAMRDAAWDLKNDPSQGATGPKDGWVHVAFTVQCGGGPVRMYKNGVEIDRNGATYEPEHLPVINQPLSIGGKAVFSAGTLLPDTHFFDGQIDDVALFNRALTPEEVKRLYEASKPVHASHN